MNNVSSVEVDVELVVYCCDRHIQACSKEIQSLRGEGSSWFYRRPIAGLVDAIELATQLKNACCVTNQPVIRLSIQDANFIHECMTLYDMSDLYGDREYEDC